MTNIQLVIIIPEEHYNAVKNGQNEETYGREFADAIVNGTPLKEHGRLVDADAADGEWVCTYDGDYKCTKCCSCDSCLYGEYQCYTDIRNLPTIIGPYKAENENKT